MRRHVLVTGGSRGIGREIALALGASGAHITLTYRNREDCAREVIADLISRGVRATALALDLADADLVTDTIEKAGAELGPIDILVNNAAMIQEKPFEELSLEDWDQMQAVNLRGPFLCSQRVLPAMIERGWGRIVNLSSIGGQWGGTRQVHYAAAKAGLIGLTRSLAKLGAQHGVTVNAIAPGLVETEMIRNELLGSEGKAKAAAIPVGRVGRPDEVASAVRYLCSDEAAYVTGQTLNLNGGMLLQ